MKLTDEDLRSLVVQRFGDAMTDHQTLTADRERALDFYFGKPLGNEIDGRSQIVSKDFMDTVEWLMPSLMRIFTTKQAVQFDPEGPEDEKLAKQESEYVSHVLWKENDGFMLIYSWLKDALTQKVGYVKYWWEETEKVCHDEYTGLTQDQLTQLMQELETTGDVEIVGADIGHTAPGIPQTFDVRLKITTKHGKLIVEPVPPDEVIVSGDCRGGVKNAKFAGHIRKITRSELREMGFTRAELEGVTDFTWSQSSVSVARSDNQPERGSDEGVDWATKELTLLECYTSIDVDDDGYAELRHFLVHGNGFLINEECDEIQMESWTPIPTPHRHAGIDLFDLTEDSQRINTGLTRGLLDNTYFGNNHRIAYNKNTVNVNMLQVNRPGGHVAVNGPPGMDIVPLPVADIGPRLLPVIEFFQMRREKATGVGEMTTGVDADVLAQSTKGAYMQAAGAANQRIEAIARVFAETGLSSLYSSMHKLLMKHQDWPTRFKLRNDWVTVNPAEWKERANLSVSVGLGTSGKEEIRANLGAMGQVLQTLGQIPGLVMPQNAYNYGMRMQAELGFEGEAFITDPSSPEYKQFMQAQSQPPVDPYVEGAKIKAQADTQKALIDASTKDKDRANERDLAITKMEVDSGIDLALAGIGAEVAHARASTPKGPAGSGTAEQSPAQ
jgi:hypothetical protein